MLRFGGRPPPNEPFESTEQIRSQRLLWASTSVKDPAYRDVMYVEELMGPDTVNTMPPSTLESFGEHGVPRASLEEDIQAARDAMQTLEQVGISMREVTDKLLTDGVRLFAEAFDKLLGAVDKRCKGEAPAKVIRQTYTLPEDLAAAVKTSLEDWRASGKARRLWARDASLWTGADEGNWLVWLGITEDQSAHYHRFTELAPEVKSAGCSHALLLGMGGSSLCPEVMSITFGKLKGYPELLVLDSTDPAQIKNFESKVDLANTIFIVSSKSGSTHEPNIFKQYFFERVAQALGANRAGERFMAVTDPDSKLQQLPGVSGARSASAAPSSGCGRAGGSGDAARGHGTGLEIAT